MRKLVTILIVTFAAISCGNIRDAHNILLDIETFINERPDSALVILNSFDASFLENRSVWAHHSLLHAQAKDKCYIDETDDSLMTQVVNYYENKRDKEKLFKAYYYLGRIQYNAGDYAESMLSYTKAEQVIDKVDDDFFKGLLYAQLGMLNQKYYDYHKALEMYMLAFEYYKSAGLLSHQFYAKLNIGYIFHELKSYEDAERLFKEIILWSYDNKQDILCQTALECLITLYDEIGRNNDSIELINGEYGSLFKESPYVLRTKAYKMAMNGQIQAIDIIRNRVWFYTNTLEDTVHNYIYECRINKLLGRYEDALEGYEKVYYIKDTLLYASLQHPLLYVKNKYLQAEYENASLYIKSQRTKTITGIIMVFWLLITVVVYVRKKIKIKDLEIRNYVEAAEDLEKSLLAKREELERISIDMGNIDKELKESNSFISSLFFKQYELLNKLTSTYYETHGCNKDKEAIYRQVSNEIERMSSDKICIQQLEELVNCYKGNIMYLIRESLPNLTEMEYRLLCYLCVGFSAKAISIFTGDSTNNIYVKKYRLKTDIMKLDEDTRDLILAAINSR